MFLREEEKHIKLVFVSWVEGWRKLYSLPVHRAIYYFVDVGSLQIKKNKSEEEKSWVYVC